MKKPVLQRKLFANGGQVNSDARGILSGFDETEEGYEERNPENLEIIANNLRGDIRSMDERYLELAQLVGESAFETPEEVVALMQGQLAEQGPPQDIMDAGIGALGAPEPSQGGGILSGMEEAGMGAQPMPNITPDQAAMMAPPGGQQAPLQMADGGIVYRANGSSPFGEVPRGVTGRPLAGGNIPQMNLDAMRSARALSEMQSGAAPWYTRAGQQLYGTAAGIGQKIMPFIRDIPRTIRSTPYGRSALIGGTALGGGVLGEALMGRRPEDVPEGGPVYSEVPGVDEQGRYQPVLRTLENMPSTPEQREAVREMGMDPFNIMPRLGAADIVPAGPDTRSIIAEGTSYFPETADEERQRVARERPILEPAREQETTFRDRIKDKLDIYSEFMGTDPEMRKAQALFAIAEAALNVATARGRSVGESIAMGMRGLPSALGAIGAEAERDRRSIAAAAVQSVENEIAAEKKAASDLYKAMLNKKVTKADQYSSILSQRFPDMSEGERDLLAQELELETVKPLPTGEIVDTLGGQIRYSPYRPLDQGSVGYMDSANPFVVDTGETVSPATIDERKDLINRRADLQKSIARNEKMLADIYGDTIGFLPTIRSGVSRMTLATVGDVGFGLTDVSKNQIRQNLAINRENILKSNLRNAGRPSVYDQKKIESLIQDPNALFASPELVVSSVQNFVREDINELARIDSQLFGVPVKEMERIPTGSRSDPIRLGPNMSMVLDQIFTKRPNASIWTVRPDGSTARMTAPEFFAQRRGQPQ